LDDGRYKDDVRKEQQTWIQRGVSGVPAMVFSDKYLVTGAQGVENYTQILTNVATEQESETT